MNKKAQASEGVLWIVRLLFIIVPLIFAVTWFTSSNLLSLNVASQESSFLVERIPSCFFKSGAIIKEKFTSEQLENCYSFGNEGAIGIELFFEGEFSKIKTSKFDLLKPLCSIQKGTAPNCFKFRKKVLVEDNGLKPGYLDVTLMLNKRTV